MENVCVVVLGFYGSKPRNVEKYSKIWESELGIKKTVSNPCSGHLSLLFLGYSDAKKVLEEIRNETKLIFHVLSNRGMSVYLQVLARLPKTCEVLGVIFDSCPGSLSPWLFFRALAANQKTVLGKYFFELFPFVSLGLIGYRFKFIRVFIACLISEIFYLGFTYWYLRKVAYSKNVPTLFIYSSIDALVYATDVEQTANLREEFGVKVYRKRFENSEHVKHVYQNETEYIDELKKFSRIVID